MAIHDEEPEAKQADGNMNRVMHEDGTCKYFSSYGSHAGHRYHSAGIENCEEYDDREEELPEPAVVHKDGQSEKIPECCCNSLTALEIGKDREAMAQAAGKPRKGNCRLINEPCHTHSHYSL